MSNCATAAIGSPAPRSERSVDPLIPESTVFSADRTHRFTLFRYWSNPEMCSHLRYYAIMVNACPHSSQTCRESAHQNTTSCF